MRPWIVLGLFVSLGVVGYGERDRDRDKTFDDVVRKNAERMLEEGRRIFRFDTFGDEAFWSGALKLHQAIAGERNGGVGPGVSPATALAVGLKVDAEALPDDVLKAIRRGRVNLNDPAVTLALLDLNAVVGLTGRRGPDGRLATVGIQCSLCHSTVDNSVAPGIGRRLDGWPNRDLNVGAIIALAPDLSVVADLLQTDQATVRTVLNSWGPGKFDAELFLDGKAFRPDGKSAATLHPGGVRTRRRQPAHLYRLGRRRALERVRRQPRDARPGHVHRRAARRSAAVSGRGARRIRQRAQRSGSHHVEAAGAALLPAVDSGAGAAARLVRAGRRPNGARRSSTAARPARAATCRRSTPSRAGTCTRRRRSASTTSRPTARPTGRYRTTPLGGLFTRQKGGFYHDGRFADLRAVVDHYNVAFNLNLTEQAKRDLVEYLKSL